MLTVIFPRAMLAGWYFRTPPSDILWPSIDDPIWPAGMPLERRMAPAWSQVKYWWLYYDFDRTYAPRLLAATLLVAMLSGLGSCLWFNHPFIGPLSLCVFCLSLTLSLMTYRDWRSWDPRDWAQFVMMWPHLRIRQWTDPHEMDRPSWWPQGLWIPMTRRTYRYLGYAVISPFALLAALAICALGVVVLGIFGIGLTAILIGMG